MEHEYIQRRETVELGISRPEWVQHTSDEDPASSSLRENWF